MTPEKIKVGDYLVLSQEFIEEYCKNGNVVVVVENWVHGIVAEVVNCGCLECVYEYSINSDDLPAVVRVLPKHLAKVLYE